MTKTKFMKKMARYAELRWQWEEDAVLGTIGDELRTVYTQVNAKDGSQDERLLREGCDHIDTRAEKWDLIDPFDDWGLSSREVESRRFQIGELLKVTA